MVRSPTPAGKLRLFLLRGLLALALVVALWLGVILWWQATQRVVSMEDVLLHLVLLPMLALAGLLAFFFLRSRKNRKASVPAAAAEINASVAAVAAPPAGHRLPVLAAWAVSSVGSDVHDFHAALKTRRQRPRPDTLLCDERGFPLMSARIADLDRAALGNRFPVAIDEARDAFLRTVALLSQLLQQAANDWPLAPEALAPSQPVQPHATLRGNPARPAQTQEPSLQLSIKLLAPSGFHPYEKEALQQQVRQELAHFPFATEAVQFELLSVADDAAALRLIDQFGAEAGHVSSPHALLLLSAESTLCDSVIEEWQAAGRLFSADHPAGLMPGEAAFGLLCINQAATAAALAEPLCSIGRMHSMLRAVSIDENRKVDASVLSEAVRHALAQSGVDGAGIAAVACDADHRGNRTLECIGAMLEHTPQLDAVQDRLAVNEACGHTGAAAVTGILVAGVMQVHDSGQPVLLFNVGHLFERAAAVLLPLDSSPQAT